MAGRGVCEEDEVNKRRVATHDTLNIARLSRVARRTPLESALTLSLPSSPRSPACHTSNSSKSAPTPSPPLPNSASYNASQRHTPHCWS